MTSGIVKSDKMLQWIIRSQALSLAIDMSAVHRLDVGGPIECFLGLRYSRADWETNWIYRRYRRSLNSKRCRFRILECYFIDL